MSQIEDFNQFRERMNARILSGNNKIIKRIFNLDTNAYETGNLDQKTKEMIGLACSLVLRCDDCVKYHLGKCFEQKFSTDEIAEVMSIATLIGGTIVIPHLRKAFDYWDELKKHVSEGS